MPQQSATTHVLMYRELVLYRRPRSQTWQCRYKIDHQWIRATTKEYDFDKARTKAKDLFIEAEIRKRNNLPIVTRKFKDIARLAVDRMMQEMRAGIGRVIYRDYMIVIEKYLTPFFGNRMITNIDYAALDEFDDWRTVTMKSTPAQSTIQTHNAALNRVFDEAVIRGYLTDVTRPKLEVKGRAGDRRPAFTIEDIKILLNGFDAWIIKAIKPRSLYNRYLLKDYVYTLIDTGARPGKEILDLKWRQIKFADDMTSVVMRVSGKTGAREILGMQRTIEALRSIAKRNHSVVSDQDLIGLTNPNNDTYIYRTPEGTNAGGCFQKMFEKYLDSLGILQDPKSEQKRVFYSLRHTYATFALTYDRVPIHTLAQQMGTSVGMIERHYSHLKVIQAIDQLRGTKTREMIGLKTKQY